MASINQLSHGEEQREKILELKEQGKKNDEIADILGIKERTVYHHLSKLRQEVPENKYLKTTKSISDSSKKELLGEIKQDDYLLDIDKKNAKNELQILKKKYGDVLVELETRKSLDELWQDLHRKSKDIRIDRNRNQPKTQSTAVMLASDWHIEENINPETINYLNEYNPEIAKERAEKFWQNGLHLVDMMAKDERIENVVVGLLGDFITGYIHPELVEENELSPTEAILYVKGLITAGIDMFLRESNYDMTIVTAFGNHGRTTDKKRISSGWKNSYERMMYNLIAEQYEKNDRVKMKVEKGYHNYLNVYDKILRFHHGDGMKYQGGVGGITIPVNKAIAQWNKAKRADIDCFGHWHQQKDGGIRVSNGSLIGYGPYAESIKADYEEPKQAMFLLNDKYGKTLTAPILVV